MIVSGIFLVVLGIGWFGIYLDQEVAASVCVVLGGLVSALSADYWINAVLKLKAPDDKPDS